LAGPDAVRLDAYRDHEAKFPAMDHDFLLAMVRGFPLAKAAAADRQDACQAHPALRQPDAHRKAVVVGVAVSAGLAVADAAPVAVKEQAVERSAPSAGLEEDSPDELELLLERPEPVQRVSV